MKTSLTTLACVLAAAGLVTPLAQAQEKVKIGFVTDMSGLYADVEGKNGALA
ncbi:MAG: ABC transporter permease, partial [Comamonas sp.]